MNNRLLRRKNIKFAAVKTNTDPPIVKETVDEKIIFTGENTNPLINILTRTSNRPNSFNRCCDSIDNQTYKNFNHIISIDDIKDSSYVINRNRNFILVNRNELINNDKSKPLNKPYSPHNLYMNILHKEINDGWVMYLDDDDYFADNNILEKISMMISNHDEDTLLTWQMKIKNRVLPRIIDLNNPPKLGNIGSSSFISHNKFLKDIYWDSWKCADFRIIKKLYEIIPKFIFIPEIFIVVPINNTGNRKDI